MARSPLTVQEAESLAKARCGERAGWLYLHIEGSPEKRGFQHGYLMAQEIRDILEMTRFVTEFTTGEPFDYFADRAVALYAGLIDDEVTAEIRGIADGATRAGVTLSFAETLAWNANTEMMWNWWPSVKGSPPGGHSHRHHH